MQLAKVEAEEARQELELGSTLPPRVQRETAEKAPMASAAHPASFIWQPTLRGHFLVTLKFSGFRGFWEVGISLTFGAKKTLKIILISEDILILSEDFLLLVTFLLVTFSWFFRGFSVAFICLEKNVWAFFVAVSWLFCGPRFGQNSRVLALEKPSKKNRPPRTPENPKN